ncbi:RAD17 protein, partial [Cercotrichas coryphoeus]|nr:RAD17 protein [Cercotrichas coryphoeus]
QVAEWLARPFDDFFGSAGIAHCAVAGRSRQQEQRAPSPGAESSKAAAPPRKRTKPCAADLPRAKPGRRRSQPREELPWVERYRPETQNDLAVQRKKIEEVETWLKKHIFQRQPKQGGSVLLLTGPPGCGKTATLQILARDLGLQVQEWTNPLSLDFTKEDLRNMFGHDSHFHTFPSQAQAALFQDFLLRANKYNKLQMLGESSESDKKLILIEDIPNQFYRDPGSLHEILRSFVRTSRCPLVFIISDNFSGDSNQRSLFPPEIVEELCIFSISFKPIAPTNMMKVLNRIAAAEASMNRENYALDRASLELLCRGCSGDIRSAINSLQFSSMKARRDKCECFFQRQLFIVQESTWYLSCGLGDISGMKVMNDANLGDWVVFLINKLKPVQSFSGEAVSEAECPQLPAHLSQHHRDALLIQPEDIVEKSHMSGGMFNLYLHQNYVDFFSDVDDVVRASEYLSTADVLCSNWSARLVMESYSVSVATRGVIHSNTSRAFAHQQGGMGFRPLHKPQWFLINKKYQENCLAAKSLFSSFCLPPECLQTELLPYLAMLANPMRNQAQIAFIQDVGRLPLKRHFGR